jgi:hypothetical protein
VLILSAVSVQAIAASGAGWVVIGQEHGAVGRERLHATIVATTHRGRRLIGPHPRG